MDTLYVLIVVALGVLAVADLVVGVSNDAVNFLNSAMGSKALSFRAIMVIASLGIACGTFFSSGLMEVARKGIFNPGAFYFDEIMFIFMAVMISDILLLDLFNSLGMPTSTTVSIVFNLLGASVAMAGLKLLANKGSVLDIWHYINTAKALEIVLGILLSVVIAFSIGALVQWLSRLWLSYDYGERPKWVGAVFGGVALSAITYFLLIKGINGTALSEMSFSFMGNLQIGRFLEEKAVAMIGLNFAFWTGFSYLLLALTKTSIYKLIIGVGTFALALAFAGNDLVNFIGVPIAGLQAFEAWTASGVPATEFKMNALSQKVPTPTILLFLSGIIMVATLWFSKKARYVADTEINLAREGEANEKFRPNYLSRSLVRMSALIGDRLNALLPRSWAAAINERFQKPAALPSKNLHKDPPAFDMVRAAINLTVAGILISVATSYKLPLSTTYVTFMVAMGTSLADRAWGAESAVYRVAGVLNVIGGWFATAMVAFVAAGGIVTAMYFGRGTAIALLLLGVAFVLARNYIAYNRKVKDIKAEDSLKRAESSSIQGIIVESAHIIANVIKRTNKLYGHSINGLARQDLALLKKNKKEVVKLSHEIEGLRDHIFYFIKNLDETSVGASNFYIALLAELQDLVQSIEYISQISHKHVNNNHKKLRYNQIKELKEIEGRLHSVLASSQKAFEEGSFEKIGTLLDSKDSLDHLISLKIKKQVERTRSEESSPKNTTLYFSLLQETKDLVKATMHLLELYYKQYDAKVEPAKAQELV